MARLKSFVTKAGFYEMAVAAPSMAAALRAWGMPQNAFATGLAEVTKVKTIIDATMAAPGVVLRRPIGSKGAFQKNPEAVKAPKGGSKKAAMPKRNEAAIKRAADALARAEGAHESIIAKLAASRAKLEQAEEMEADRWSKERQTLENAAEKARRRK